MKMIDKTFIEQIFAANSVDEATHRLFEEFGPCRRSEYFIDKERLVDMDWEDLGLVITLSHDRLSQLYLSINEEETTTFDGWIGDDVEVIACEHDEVFQRPQRYAYFHMNYNFNDDCSLQSVVLTKK